MDMVRMMCNGGCGGGRASYVLEAAVEDLQLPLVEVGQRLQLAQGAGGGGGGGRDAGGARRPLQQRVGRGAAGVALALLRGAGHHAQQLVLLGQLVLQLVHLESDGLRDSLPGSRPGDQSGGWLVTGKVAGSIPPGSS